MKVRFLSEDQSSVNGESNDVGWLFQQLLSRYGPQGWWPASELFELVVGALLTQNTTWTQVERVIAVLRQRQLLTIDAIRHVDDQTLWPLLRPTGYFRVKTQRLRAMVQFLGRFNDDWRQLFQYDTDHLRQLLLQVNGIGPETADCILCYGAGRPLFVADRYSQRLLARLGWIQDNAGYDATQHWVQQRFPVDAVALGELHALIVRHAKVHCQATPRCQDCCCGGRCCAPLAIK
ncbi:MAG: endonuclease [Magnetococcales bacterium]|nr:endonuclease [Magnetococcales bacterium]